jgi:hypothetical protein
MLDGDFAKCAGNGDSILDQSGGSKEVEIKDEKCVYTRRNRVFLNPYNHYGAIHKIKYVTLFLPIFYLSLPKICDSKPRTPSKKKIQRKLNMQPGLAESVSISGADCNFWSGLNKLDF